MALPVNEAVTLAA